jgi:steroid delta-isomerase-like uncharacterized protein
VARPVAVPADAVTLCEEERYRMTDVTTSPLLDAVFLDDFSHRWIEAWNGRDGGALAALCTEDIEFYDPAIGTIRGRAAVADWVGICARAFPDYRFEEPEPAYLSRDSAKAIVPWRMVGTNTGPLDPPGFAPTGRSFVIDGVDHWWFRDGLVERYRADYDLNGGLRQLGLVPESGSRGERALVRLQRLGARLRRGR